jgi:hypothetical protein
MFQIETALLKFDGMQDGKTSVVKRCVISRLRLPSHKFMFSQGCSTARCDNV